MTWQSDDGHGQGPPQPAAPPPVDTYGQALPKEPPQSMVQPLGAPPPMLTAEDVKAALENARRLRQLKLDALAIAVQNEAREDAITTLHGSEAPYFSEWFLHDLWAITGGGRLSCLQPPTRYPLDAGHYYYASTWRAEHRYFGSVDGFGIASSADSFLGENQKENSRGELVGRALEKVSPHSIAQHASTRAKRSAMEELLGTQGWSWELLRRLRAGQSVNLADLQNTAAPTGAPPPSSGGPPPPAAAQPGPPAPSNGGTPPPPAASAPQEPPAGRLELSADQLKAKTPPAGWTPQRGPEPTGSGDSREPPLAYLGRLVKSGLVTAEELLAHARVREGYMGLSIREAPPELQGEVAWACCQDVAWVKAAAGYEVQSVVDDIPF